MSDSRKEGPEKESSSLGQVVRELGPYMSLGFQLAAAVVGFFLLGHWLDNRYGTSPWLKLLGLLLGTTGGFIKFFKTVAGLDKKKSNKDSNRS